MQPQDRDAVALGSGWPDAAVGAVAAGQKTLITHRQLLELGISRSAIHRAARRGRLLPVHRGVYSLVGPPARPRWADELAAVLAGGATAVVSHASAARVHGLPAPGRTVAVEILIVGAGHRRTRDGIVVHRTTVLHPQERVRAQGLPLTSVARTAIDLSPRLNHLARGNLLDEALKRTSRTKLIEALDRHPGRPGTPQLRLLLAGGRPGARAASDPEKVLLAIIGRAGLPTPLVNVTLQDGYRPDLLWPRERVIVEYDSRDHHTGPYAFVSDRTRHNRLEAQGYAVLHVTGEHLAQRPEEVIVWIAQALARAR